MGLPAKKAGLKERRVVDDFINNTFPEWQDRLNKVVGKNMPMDVDWDSFYHQGADPQYWAENFVRVYFKPLVEGMENICQDNMGKEALQATFNQVRLQNSDGRYRNCCSKDGDTFVFDHAPDSNVDYENERVKEIVAFLEQNL